MDEKIVSIKKNDIWKLVPRPKEKKSISVKWIYKEKNNMKWEVERYNARLVVKNYSQNQEINYDEVFVLIARLKEFKCHKKNLWKFMWITH
jgi:hypothetical protein